MKRLFAVICLGILILSGLYLFEIFSIRRELKRQSIEIAQKLRYASEQNQNAAKLYFESIQRNRSQGRTPKEFAQVYPGLMPTAYSELGMPKSSSLPPISPTARPQKTAVIGDVLYWLQTRFVAKDGTLWIETLGSTQRWPVGPESNGAPIAGLASAVPKELLSRPGKTVDLQLNAQPPRGLARLTTMPINFPGDPTLSSKLALHFQIRKWVHLFFILLAWAFVVTFVRLLTYKPFESGKREMQLEEELAYLSKTYQSLSKNLRMERQKVEAILNSAPDGIFTCSPDGIVTFWNRSMETMTHLSKEVTVGKHYRDNMNIFSASGQFLADPLLLESSRGRNLNLSDCRLEALNAPDGSAEHMILPVALGAAPVTLADGSVDEIVVTVKDIRAQKEAEQLRQDMQAMITHDLRSPLSAMLGYAGLIRNSKITKNEEDANKYLDSLVRAGKEMLILISNLLGWSWIEEGKLNFHKESLQIAPILKEAVEGLGVLAKPKNLSIAVGAPEDLWALTDGDKVKEILNNLISNAIKFSRPGGTVRVSAEGEEDKVRISVTDQGPGISPEEKANLFEKFSGLRKAGSGTGLGLFVVKTLTEALDGSVEVESELGRGSTFSILLPAYQRVVTHSQQLSLLSLVNTE